MKTENIILDKSFQFAIKIVELSKHLDSMKVLALSNQILKSGTSIGANISEAQNAQSRKDFVSKLGIALKEASETDYWLRLLNATGYLEDVSFNLLINDCKEIERLLTSIIKSSKTML